MKFPKRLSKERISLLSAEDKAIYEKEWASFSQSGQVSESGESSFILELISEEYIKESTDIANAIVLEEMRNLYEEVYKDIIPESEFEDFLSEMFDNTDNTPVTDKSQLITENAEGQDAYAWIRGVPWIGKLAAAGLGLLGTGLTALIIAGKDKLAIAKLKYFMNRLVELTDQGVHKKRPWYSFLTPSKRKRNNMGEYNMGCFRMIQETADRNMTVAVMQSAHRLGYFSSGNMMNISNGEGPQVGGGLDAFNQNVLSKLNVVNS